MTISDILKQMDEGVLLKQWQHLSSADQEVIEQQIKAIKISLLKEQKKILATRYPATPFTYRPLQQKVRKPLPEETILGKKIIESGQVGCVLLAGGQGSRLQFFRSKGCFPISCVKHKSLFQLVCEKVKTAGKQVGKELLLAIMTSSINHEETIQFIQAHHFFGLKREQLFFFQQDNLPILSQDGHLFLSHTASLAEGPDGNGSVFKHFVHSGIFDLWHQKGIKLINLVFVDNPLADPFDPAFVGFHDSNLYDVSIKCILKHDTQEKVGVLAQDDQGKIRVVEYSELSQDDLTSYNSDMSLVYPYANSGLFCFNMDFVHKMSNEHLPLHLAFKAISYLNQEGKQVTPDQPNAWKFEKFIFDCLPFAKQVGITLYPRELCFAPLKNLNSVEEVKRDLFRRDQIQWENVTGTLPPPDLFELDQEFYYPTDQLLKKWKGMKAPSFTFLENNDNQRYIIP